MGNTASSLIEHITESGVDVTKIIKEWYNEDETEVGDFPEPDIPDNKKEAFFGQDWTYELTPKEFSIIKYEFNNLVKNIDNPLIVEVNSGLKPISKEIFSDVKIITSDLFGQDEILQKTAHETVNDIHEDIDIVISFKPPPNLVCGPELASAYEFVKKEQSKTKYFVCYGEMGGGEGSNDFWPWMKEMGWELEKCLTIHCFIDMFSGKKCWKTLNIFKKI